MSQTPASTLKPEAVAPVSRGREYYELCKPRVVMLIVFTAIVGMFLAVPGLPPLAALLWGTIGISLQAASAAAVNQIIDREIDARMARTCGRPLVTGTLSLTESIAFATAIGLAGFAVLWFLVNPLTAVLTQLTLVGYAGVYTLFLKRATPQNIVIGGASGAAPPVLGWVAVTGTIDPHSLILFLIIFIWTPPHFWALALLKQVDYGRAKVPMAPLVWGERETMHQMVWYTVILVVLTLLPVLFGAFGTLYLVSAIVLNALLAGGIAKMLMAARAGRPWSGPAWWVYKYSLLYLALLFLAMAVDRALTR